LNTSYDALNCDVPQWNHAAVGTYLREKLVTPGTQQRSRYEEVIIKAFCESGFSRDSLDDRGRPLSFSPPWGEGTIRLRRGFSESTATAIECCALLAALNISFVQARSGFEAAAQSVLATVDKPTKFDMPSNICEARTMFLAAQPSFASQGPRQYRIYWMLQLYDREWMERHTRRSPQIPSLEHDRAEILKVINDRKITPMQCRQKVTHQTPGIRASLRDPAWYSMQLASIDSRILQRTNEFRQRERTKLEKAIRSALERSLDGKQEPQLVTSGLLASFAGLGRSVVAKAIGKNRELRASIQRVNADRPRRQLLWAARQLMKTEQQITFTAILRRARLSATRQINALKSQIFKELGLL
jgi:hypothetical protein